MHKTKRRLAFFVIAVLVYSLVSVYGLTPNVNAASLNDAKATLSDSDTGVTATSTISFTTGVALTQNFYIQVDMPTGFINVDASRVTCPANSTSSVSGAGPYTVKCTVNIGQTLAAGAYTVVVGGHTNPGVGDYTINIYTKSDTDVEQEKAQVKVYIIDDVTVTATVPASLTFAIAGLDVGDSVNGVDVTATSTATTTPFGTLSTTASSTVGQKLTVGTNATDGYTVTVFQSQELTTAGGANINSFNNANDGTGSTTPVGWASPSGILDSTWTYGHMGVTTDDGSLSGASPSRFSGSKYAGLSGTNPLEIMHHGGPANQTGTGIGTTKVAYTVQISALQEAGDYTTSLTYVCTPQF
jgi:hypothetical protein